MAHNLYLILVVAFRFFALYLIGSTLITGSVTFLALSSVSGGFASTFGIGAAIAIFGGIALWYLAKPLANLITRDLH